MGQRVVSRALKTFHRSELREIRTMSINRLYFKNGCTNLWLHIFTDASEEKNVHRGISARRRNVETHLCDRKMLCSAYQTHDNSEVRTSSRIKRSSYQKACIAKSWCINWKSLSLQETASVCCQQSCRNNGKLFHGSMETCERHQKPSRCRHKRGVHWKPKDSGCLNGLVWLQIYEESGQIRDAKWTKPKLRKLLVL